MAIAVWQALIHSLTYLLGGRNLDEATHCTQQGGGRDKALASQSESRVTDVVRVVAGRWLAVHLN
jgi:hypothetical protein